MADESLPTPASVINPVQAARLETSNRVLELLTARSENDGLRKTWIERRKGGWYVCWHGWRYQSEIMSRRWNARGGGFYPTWSHKWGHGGTMTTALANLVRWCGAKPVLPLPTWRYWCAEKCWLARERGPQVIQALESGGYPQQALCVLCNQPITAGMDWWSLNGVSGPCCGWTTGCRQKGA